jgi:hypothetical protein
MSNNTQAQGRSYQTEAGFTYVPVSSDDPTRALNRWQIQLERQLQVGDVTEDPAAKAAALAVVPPARPSATVVPVVTGTLTVGSTLTVSNGTWSASPAVSGYTYRWFVNNVVVPGATTATFTAVAGSISAEVRATNTVGFTTKRSAAVVVPAA